MGSRLMAQSYVGRRPISKGIGGAIRKFMMLISISVFTLTKSRPLQVADSICFSSIPDNRRSLIAGVRSGDEIHPNYHLELSAGPSRKNKESAMILTTAHKL